MFEEEPFPRVIESLSRHLLEAHDLDDFDLARDLWWEHNRPEEPRAMYLVEYGLVPPGFECYVCGRRVFSEPSFGHPQRNLDLRLDPSNGLQVLLRGVPSERWDEVIEDWDRGEHGRRQLRSLDVRKATAVRDGRRPEDERRIAASQRFLLEHCREHGNVEQAVEALVALEKDDPDRHWEIFGRAHAYGADTYRGHWKQIPLEVRNAARDEGKERVAAAKAAKTAELRKGFNRG